MREISLDIIGTPAEVRRRGGIVPAWVVFGMVILGTFAICVAVTMRSRNGLSLASQQYVRMQSDVEELKSGNEALRSEIQQLNSNPRVIEVAARTRLNMVRANEIVIPIE